LLDMPSMTGRTLGPGLDLEELRRRLAGKTGPAYWRSLDELAESPAFLDYLASEFPARASEWTDPAGRRQFLALMGASLALAGLTGCTRQPTERIVPYVKAPERLVPGKPLFFATAVLEGGYAKGVLVESHMGRPTKVEGNPDHPQSLGATDALGQASVLALYDPDRSQGVTFVGEIRPWGAFASAVRTAVETQRAHRGAGLRILTETVTSPTLAAQIQALLAELPDAGWHQYDPCYRNNSRMGAVLAFGEAVEPQLRLDRAEVVLSLEDDLVGWGPASLPQIRGLAVRRRLHADASLMSRIYVVESSPTATGALADHRLPLRSGEIEAFARRLAQAVGLSVEAGSAFPPGSFAGRWIEAAARDLVARGGASIVTVGESQPPAVHALAHAINSRLGAPGRTVVYTTPAEARCEDQIASIRALASDMDSGRVSVLLVLGANPVLTAPADLDFAAKLQKVPLRIHVGLGADETAAHCHWHVPQAHPLETWGDARAVDGTATILQPLIAPLHGGKSELEVLSAFLGRADRTAHDLVYEQWRKTAPAADFEAWFRKAIHDGVVPGTASPERAVSPRLEAWARRAPQAEPAQQLELVFRLDPSVVDGRYANSGWLQELPRPITKLTWDNAALVAPRTAERLHLGNGDLVTLRCAGREVEAPAWIVPGQADGTVTVHLGYGRTRAGRVGDGVGFDAYTLRTTNRLWFGAGLTLARTERRRALACTQDHWSMEGRDLLRSASIEELRADPRFAQERGHEPDPKLSLYPPVAYSGHAWGMVIDLNACVGCNACVVACQAENNIPVVGRDQVSRGREMHWIRIDRYFEGELDSPKIHHQPVLCMHCENAPCEVVCPVAATVHSDEGLNDMVYNRCVGTKYCSNNCPYKVRRFNFHLYQDWTTESLKLQRNPDVTVRSRGVMEKCTFCVQRINHARIEAANAGRGMRDGDVATACEAACPARAITFGDQNDAASRVAVLKREPRNYALLGELNTRPRLSYLASIRNPNPEIPNG
jgi:MoCo/4Fe-4S cofactor protein with predicted Tat translocation signal